MRTRRKPCACVRGTASVPQRAAIAPGQRRLSGLATVGATEAVAAFERIGWGPARNDWHDLGIDLFIQVRDQRRFDRGLVITAQVKGGTSAFDEPVVEDGIVVGWTYRDDSYRFDDWVTDDLATPPSPCRS